MPHNATPESAAHARLARTPESYSRGPSSNAHRDACRQKLYTRATTPAVLDAARKRTGRPRVNGDVCSRVECDKTATHRGMCHRHYKQVKGNTPKRPRLVDRTPRRTRDRDVLTYRAEKRMGEKRKAHVMVEAKAAYDRLMADLAQKAKGGRPRQPKGVPHGE